MRSTLADAKASRIPEILNLHPDDPRFLSYLNEAMPRLLHKGKWWGTCARYRMCALDSCLTLPRQIDTIEAAAVCGQPIPVRDFWYEFLENGFGLRSNASSSGCGGGVCGTNEAIYRGHFPSFDDIRGTDKKLRLVCDRASDVGKQVLVLGYDANQNWIRTTQDTWIRDGERVSLAQSPGTMTNNGYLALTDLQLPDNLDGQVWLYEYNTTASTQRLIGRYEYDETRPSYARYFFPAIGSASDCSSQTMVELAGKLAFIPVKNDTDYLIIGNIPALKNMALAVKRYEEDQVQEAAAFETLAIRELDQELDHHLGSGRKMGINLIGSSIGAADPIEVLI